MINHNNTNNNNNNNNFDVITFPRARRNAKNYYENDISRNIKFLVSDYLIQS